MQVHCSFGGENMKKYLFQRFLPDCDTSKIDLSELYVDNVDSKQMISVSYLDEKIDTEEDLERFLNQYNPNKNLILNDDRSIFLNPILKDYAEKTFKSYLVWFAKKGYNCHWARKIS